MNAPSTPQSKRVVIVDDHPLIRQGLDQLLSMGDRFVVCGEAGTANEALQVLRKTKPELAIVDISVPDTNGIELSKKNRRRISGIKNPFNA